MVKIRFSQKGRSLKIWLLWSIDTLQIFETNIDSAQKGCKELQLPSLKVLSSEMDPAQIRLIR
jgi:hypothetical protein